MLQLDYTRIAPNAPYLRMKDLRPGDVLLSRGKSHLKNRFEPALIALGTLGWYSHAAVFIWLKPPAEGAPGLLQLIESEDQGAGWTELTNSRSHSTVNPSKTSRRYRAHQLGRLYFGIR